MATESSPFDTEVSTRKTSVSQRKQIIAIANSHISGRKLGAPLTNMALSILRDKSYEHTDYHLHYYSININGKDLRSSTFFIKDSTRRRRQTMFQEYLRRIGLLLGGLLVSAIGITLMLQANIGLEPWSVLQQGMSKTFGITYGTAASIVGAAVIAIAYFCGESFGLGTLANIFVCPIFIDILLYLNWIPLFERFSTGLAALLIGMELLALGTWMYMKSTLGSGPRDALMVVLARKTHRTVGLCRAAVEVVIVFIGWRLGGQVGIGTIVAAVGVGSLFNLNFALLRFNPALLHQENLPETLQRFRGRKTIT